MSLLFSVNQIHTAGPMQFKRFFEERLFNAGYCSELNPYSAFNVEFDAEYVASDKICRVSGDTSTCSRKHLSPGQCSAANLPHAQMDDLS